MERPKAGKTLNHPELDIFILFTSMIEEIAATVYYIYINLLFDWYPGRCPANISNRR